MGGREPDQEAVTEGGREEDRGKERGGGEMGLLPSSVYSRKY